MHLVIYFKIKQTLYILDERLNNRYKTLHCIRQEYSLEPLLVNNQSKLLVF